MNPTLSVIVPVYNGGRFLGQALESVLNQRFESLEIVIVDDGSTDNTPDVVAAFGAGARYVRQENRGPSAARNRAIGLAQAPILAFLDADDLWPPDKLVRQLPLIPLIERSATDIVMGFTQVIFTDPEDASRYTPAAGPRLSLSVGACLYRRDAFDRFGGFDERICGAEDLDWLLRAREAGARIDIVPAVTLLYRENPGSLTNALTTSQLDFFRILKRSLDRRNAPGVNLAPMGRSIER